jgi:hypothetical protein
VCRDASQAVSTGRLDRAGPAHALAGRRISWHGRRYRVLPEREVSSYILWLLLFFCVVLKRDSKMKSLLQQFDDAMLNIYDRAKNEADYTPTLFFRHAQETSRPSNCQTPD